MDLSRITRGKIELRKERYLRCGRHIAVETSRPLIEEMDHRLTIALPGRPIAVNADLTRLSQVFMNLLNNAAKYSDRGWSHLADRRTRRKRSRGFRQGHWHWNRRRPNAAHLRNVHAGRTTRWKSRREAWGSA